MFFTPLKIILFLANSAEPDEMPHSGSALFDKVLIYRFQVNKQMKVSII